MEKGKTPSLEERLSMDLKRFGAPYSGKKAQNPATDEQWKNALTSMIEYFEQEPTPSKSKESYTDTDLFR